jgi:hypothetical protein
MLARVGRAKKCRGVNKTWATSGRGVTLQPQNGIDLPLACCHTVGWKALYQSILVLWQRRLAYGNTCFRWC